MCGAGAWEDGGLCGAGERGEVERGLGGGGGVGPPCKRVSFATNVANHCGVRVEGSQTCGTRSARAGSRPLSGTIWLRRGAQSGGTAPQSVKANAFLNDRVAPTGSARNVGQECLCNVLIAVQGTTSQDPFGIRNRHRSDFPPGSREQRDPGMFRKCSKPPGVVERARAPPHLGNEEEDVAARPETLEQRHRHEHQQRHSRGDE